MSGVLVYADVRDGVVNPVTYEVLSAARKVADSFGGQVGAALIGSGVSGVANDLIARGADTVYVVDDASFAQYQNATYLSALEAIAGQADPQVVIFGKSFVSLDLAPRFAFRKGVGFANDAISIRVEDGKVVATRPVYGGSALADVLAEGTPQVIGIRAKTQEVLPADSSRQGNVVNVSASGSPAVTVTGVQKTESTGPKLSEATRIVSGGRGIGEAKENWDQLEALAKTLGGAVGASRAAVDAGWVPPHLQIGLTGATVSPDLYIAVAISGAVQHMAGMSSSKTIVAINKDPDAAIFKSSRFGVEGDWKKIIPALNEEIKKL